MTTEQKEMASEVSLLKAKAMRIGLYRTGRMLEIAVQEIGWELQGVETTEWQRLGAQSRHSVQRIVRCAFTASEANHILSLIASNERNGEHTAPRDQYWKRSERIKSKLANTPNAALCDPAHGGAGKPKTL